MHIFLDLPPPPPDMFDHEHEAPKSGGTFKSMQQHIEAGTAGILSNLKFA